MISFIIPAYDEELFLGPTLTALHAAARAVGDEYEIIVADDDSSDRTIAVAEAHGAHVVRVAHRQIAATRNAGAREAKGDRLVFVDADTIVSEAALRATMEALHAGAAGGGAAVRFDGRLPPYARVVLPLALGIYRLAGVAPGCFVYCSRRAFEAAGGFDETLFGAEELAMSRALGRQGRFVLLREPVTTSGRKLRAYSGWEILRILGGLALRGPGSVRGRRGLEIWYGKRRRDPEPTG